LKKIPSTPHDASVAGELPFHIYILMSKENLTREFENTVEEIQVFSDGSAQGGKVGAAAILTRKDKPDHILHFHLGSNTEHTVYDAELVGMVLAMHLIATKKRSATQCLIAVDNQVALKAFSSDIQCPGHHLVQEFLLIANRMQKHRRKCRYKLMLRWSAGHCGIEGNEKADGEAKKAASRTTSSAKLLPPYLRKLLLMNPTTVKRAYSDNLINTWKADWLSLTRGKKMGLLDSFTPSTKFLKTISNAKLSCEVASRIAQLRLQHAPLNSYLFKFKKVDKANCPACGNKDKSTTHFLLGCPVYACERWPLVQLAHRKCKALSLETLLGDPDFAIPLANFIKGTNRFKYNIKTHMQVLSTILECKDDIWAAHASAISQIFTGEPLPPIT